MLQASRSCLSGATTRRLHTNNHWMELDQVLKVRFRMPMISTLRPEKLVHSDFLVLAGRKRLSFHTQLSLRSLSEKGQRESTKLAYAKIPGGGKNDTKLEGDAVMASAKFAPVPFPRHAQGFLYLHQESGLPRSDSSVRIRCTPSLVEASAAYVASSAQEPEKKLAPRSEPASFLPPSVSNTEIYEAFEAGYDLITPNGRPWDIPVIFIAGRPYLNYIRMQLLADELFSESELLGYENISKSTNKTKKPSAATS